jgi:thiol-disulfide isomerase/thioredoxin
MRGFTLAILVAIQALASVAWAQTEDWTPHRLDEGIVRLAQDSDGCDCEKCECPTQDVCRDKACGKRYVVLFTTAGCEPCEKQKTTMAALKKAGFLVFIADDPRAAEHYGVKQFPTILLMDDRKEVKRWKGITPYSELSKMLKVEPKPKPKVNEPVDYQLW